MATTRRWYDRGNPRDAGERHACQTVFYLKNSFDQSRRFSYAQKEENMSDVKIVYRGANPPEVYIDGHKVQCVFNFEITQGVGEPQKLRLDLYPSGVKIEYEKIQ